MSFLVCYLDVRPFFARQIIRLGRRFAHRREWIVHAAEDPRRKKLSFVTLPVHAVPYVFGGSARNFRSVSVALTELFVVLIF
ncbi:MAG: hypothetical protein JWM42_2922 [Burkholderia sp.]|nr:hypothetical protein [Burkholderia sp.]